MEIKATLTAINSKQDTAGNRYWAFEYHELDTDKTVRGKISGGESNIYSILRYTGHADDWDRSIIFQRQELKIREFDRLTKGWSYAGCTPEELAAYIKKELAK